MIVLEDVSELRRLQQIRAEFVDNLSHELRTPLSTISLLAETLARDADAAGDGVPAEMRDRIAKIEVETGHLVQMVNELLDLARIESGGPLVLLDDVDIGRVAAESAERLRLFAERQGVTLVVDVAGRPAAGPRRRGRTRAGRRQPRPQRGQVQRRTAATSRSGPRARRRARSSSRSPTTGSASRKADQARIFERFYKVDRARVRAAAARASGWRSRGTSSSSTAVGSGSSRRRGRVDVLVRRCPPPRSPETAH